MKFLIAFIILAAVFALTVYASFKLYRQQKAEIESLKSELKDQKKYMDLLLKYSKELKSINIDKERLQAEIEGAENEKKLMDIINTIIANNNKLCNDTEN